MSIYKTEIIKKKINGVDVLVSDASVINNENYVTNGESVLIIKDVTLCVVHLNSKTTDHIVVKALTNVLVTSDSLIDEEFNEVDLSKGACVEFRKIGDFWYILSSDGLKGS